MKRRLTKYLRSLLEAADAPVLNAIEHLGYEVRELPKVIAALLDRPRPALVHLFAFSGDVVLSTSNEQSSGCFYLELVNQERHLEHVRVVVVADPRRVHVRQIVRGVQIISTDSWFGFCDWPVGMVLHAEVVASWSEKLDHILDGLTPKERSIVERAAKDPLPRVAKEDK